MQRFTISLDDSLASEFDRLIAERGYGNRSEAVRDLLRSQLDRQRESADPATACVACLSYVYNHHERELAERLLALQHEHPDEAADEAEDGPGPHRVLHQREDLAVDRHAAEHGVRDVVPVHAWSS